MSRDWDVETEMIIVQCQNQGFLAPAWCAQNDQVHKKKQLLCIAEVIGCPMESHFWFKGIDVMSNIIMINQEHLLT